MTSFISRFNFPRPYVMAFRDATPIIAGYFTVSCVFGLMAVTQGLPFWLPIAMCLFVYAGASQFSFLALAANGAPLLTIVVTTFLINLRHLLMSVCMSTWMDKHGIRKNVRWLYAIGLTDESFAIHSAAFEKEALCARYLISFNAFCHLSWTCGALVGGLAAVYANQLTSIRLDYALTAMMLYVLVSLVNSKRKLGVALISITVMCLLNLITTSFFNVFFATAAGCMVGIWTRRI